ncbi:TlpA family protein disulfide reductase [Spirosoma taeanense]|uniref:TlpA family protein disulfide reductase n=1 Tax=Spirosoma taeanense TaxID=2735870 RepID=A0A6M5YBG3_9BACT|nr:TlpA disulfide reductase family protein [Spirosoma taeanense]QJW90666.1 TlpA family protein disulfide reductase [Spirosoma taeanense]
MKHQKNVLRGILFPVLCAAMFSCATKVPKLNVNEAHHSHSETASVKKYVTVKSWEHQRELYIKRGMSETEADAKISALLTGLKDMNRSAGDDRIGVAAPPFQFDAWLNSKPLTLEDLKGKVVLVRWFTDTCPFCASSAPALRSLYEEYANSGFMLIGAYHPKDGRDDPLDIQRVQSVVEARDFKFPVAIDWKWRTGTLKDWWLAGPERPATSVTFILDKSGIIRFVHPGMEYHDDNGTELHAMCTDDMVRIRAAIKRLVAE